VKISIIGSMDRYTDTWPKVVGVFVQLIVLNTPTTWKARYNFCITCMCWGYEVELDKTEK
jgi:hypothetical protein